MMEEASSSFIQRNIDPEKENRALEYSSYSGTQVKGCSKLSTSNAPQISFNGVIMNPENENSHSFVPNMGGEVGHVTYSPGNVPENGIQYVQYVPGNRNQPPRRTYPSISERLLQFPEDTPKNYFFYGVSTLLIINVLVNPIIILCSSFVYVLLLPFGLSPSSWLLFLFCSFLSLIPLITHGFGALWMASESRVGKTYGILNLVGFFFSMVAFFFYPVFGTIVHFGLYLISVFWVILYLFIFYIYCCIQLYCVY